jgi:hypothetical protein
VGRASHGNEQTNLLNERLAQMDFEPYDEAKHGKTSQSRRAAWDAFFDALQRGPVIINSTDRVTTHTAATYRGIRVSINQLANDPSRAVVTYRGERK